MEYIVTASEMKKYDKNTSSYFGISSLVLMERAALAVVEEIELRYKEKKRILIVAGSGNNGGDGFAIGRILGQRGYLVTIVFLGDSEKCSKETKTQLEIYRKYGLKVTDKIPECEYDIIIDAIFGTGLNRKVEGIYQQAISDINQKEGIKIAADIPSGLHADNGRILGVCVKADITITFAFKKRGMILYPGADYCGKIICKDIGVTRASFLDEEPLMYSYQADDIKRLPKRNKAGNKGSFGKILLLAGSMNMSGACVLSGLSAYRSGTGLVRIVTPGENREIIQKMLPEAVLDTYGENDAIISQKIKEGIQWADCIVIGPGIGKSEMAYQLVQAVLEQTQIPLVIDADALNLIAEHAKLQEKVRENTRRGAMIIMTPHMGEFSRLIKIPIEKLKEEIIENVLRYRQLYGVTLVCKDARTICCGKYGNDEKIRLYINQSGNDGMATAGSGDVLTGIIASMIAQHLQAFEAACLGVYIHGMAGDLASQVSNRYSMMANDMIEQLKYILSEEKKVE